jgi:hypothetical protein
MQSMSGVITIVQEGRFQLRDEDGVSHHFVLRHNAEVDPEQLPSLLNRRVCVSFTDPNEVIGHVALRLLVEDA